MPENAIREHQKIKLIAGQHCTYFNVSHHEANIREHQQIDPLVGLYCNYLKFCSLKTELVNISRTTTFQDSTTHI